MTDYDNITNPYQAYAYANEFDGALSLADKSKNKEIIKLFVKQLKSEKERNTLPSVLLTKYHSGHQGYYNFNCIIAKVNQARVS